MPYQLFTSARLTEPDSATLLANLRALDASAGIQHDLGSPRWIVKKDTAWLAAQITAAQNAIDTAPAASARLTAQFDIDHWPIETRALLLTLLDQINVLRTAAGMTTVTPLQAINAVKNKAATL